ncbi:MAG: molybdopterin-dependent oxidoreductase [Coriobacteriales bacterium]|jgi:Tat-targeted selenate reductase subunit YnfE/Tat-targeted selenate reductase subunit YnfF|nr:molybdopterin-dependent oxidoreductase [Coriobacteriales bacterium]
MSKQAKQAVSDLSRRTFVKGSLAGLAVAGAGLAGPLSLFGCAPEARTEGEGTDSSAATTVAWSQCNVNCGSNCAFRWHSQDGKIVYMETDNTGSTDLQARACLRGRSMRRWINSPDRLQYPMKRVGARGEGRFEQISWEEAIDTIAEQLRYTIETYGNEAIHKIYATGMYSATGNPSTRLLNVLGGCVVEHYDYSTNMMSAVMPFMYGENFSPYDNVNASSFSEAERASDLVILFGNSPAETRMGGANAVWDFARVREAVYARGGTIVNIDYRLNETSSGYPDEWLPIRPGTDAALVSALVHELMAAGQVDLDFLHTACVGFDEESMPESAKGQNKSYTDYIMGTGYDLVEKTPEWAASITQIPADRIRQLAADIAAAEAPFVCQGWGPQRHTNGEDATRAICMLPLVTGKIGLAGTNTGMREAEPPTYLVGSLPAGDNPVEITIPCYQWLNAIDHGRDMTALNAGILGGDKLGTDIKFLWNYAGNCMTNQHGDINYTHEILADESKCEFILVWDTVMTDSAKYADILLPDAMRAEQLNMQTQGYAEYYTAVGVGGPAQEPPFENRSSYDVMADIAERFDKREEFTEGRTHDEWVQFLYEEGAAANSDMPPWEEMLEQGIYKEALPPAIGLADFRANPAGNPLSTPSGKIEIYSESLADLANTWELREDEVINPLPLFTPGPDGYGAVSDEFPLYCCGFHHKSRTHSSFGFIPELEQIARQQIWVNPLDADTRQIKDGDWCSVKSKAGEIRIEARVTPRVIPGTIAIPQGAWHQASMSGDRIDEGGCVNTLTTYRPTPLAKGNGPAHSMVVQVAKA